MRRFFSVALSVLSAVTAGVLLAGPPNKGDIGGGPGGGVGGGDACPREYGPFTNQTEEDVTVTAGNGTSSSMHTVEPGGEFYCSGKIPPPGPHTHFGMCDKITACNDDGCVEVFACGEASGEAQGPDEATEAFADFAVAPGQWIHTVERDVRTLDLTYFSESGAAVKSSVEPRGQVMDQDGSYTLILVGLVDTPAGPMAVQLTDADGRLFDEWAVAE